MSLVQSLEKNIISRIISILEASKDSLITMSDEVVLYADDINKSTVVQIAENSESDFEFDFDKVDDILSNDGDVNDKNAQPNIITNNSATISLFEGDFEFSFTNP